MTTLSNKGYRENKLQIKMILIVVCAALFVSLTSVTLTYLMEASKQLNNMFTAATKYTLTYHANTSETVNYMPDPKSVTQYTKTFEVATNIPTRVGYIFVEWNTQADGKGESYDPCNRYRKFPYRYGHHPHRRKDRPHHADGDQPYQNGV